MTDEQGSVTRVTVTAQSRGELVPRADGGWDVYELTDDVPNVAQACSHKRGVTIGPGGIYCTDCQAPMLLTTRT